ncbi:hypothetical protein GTQ40_14205 [Flavobacteriaceae bacterium R38]|nr:hypothetical protein [Flavobacteriaceae bacterium R38]
MNINNLFRKGVTVCAFLLFISSQLVAQVGIGNTNPQATLDVTSTTSGVLFPRMTTIQRDAIITPATGMLIFNSDTNTFNYNSGTGVAPNWVSLSTGSSAETRAVKYSSADTTTDILTAGVVSIPIFGNLEFNDDTSLFALQNNTTLQVNEAGRYRVTVNLYTDGTNQRDQLQLGIFVNGVMQSAPFSTNELIFGVLHSSANFIDILNLNANDQISIRAEDFFATGGNVNMRTLNGQASNVIIEKIN